MKIEIHTTSSDPTTYPLGDTSANGEKRFALPEILRGSAWPMELLCTSGTAKHRVLTGYASWSEAMGTVTREEVAMVVDELDQYLLGGLPAHRYADLLAVLHRRRSGTDAHFYRYQVDLETGRPVSLITWERDKYALEMFEDIWNFRKRWSSPRDGALAFMHATFPKDLSGDSDKTCWRAIDADVVRLVRVGKPNNYQEFLHLLETAGVKVTQRYHHGIQIQDTNRKKYEYLGGVFSGEFAFAAVDRRIAEARELWWRQAPDRLPELERRYARYFAQRCELFAKRFRPDGLDAEWRTRGERQRKRWRTRAEAQLEAARGSGRDPDRNVLGARGVSGMVAREGPGGGIGGDVGETHRGVVSPVIVASEVHTISTQGGAQCAPQTITHTNRTDTRNYDDTPRPIADVSGGLDRLLGGAANSFRALGDSAAENAERAAAMLCSVLRFGGRVRALAISAGEDRENAGCGATGPSATECAAKPGGGRSREQKHLARPTILAGAATAPAGLSATLASVRDFARDSATKALSAQRSEKIIADCEGLENDPDRER